MGTRFLSGSPIEAETLQAPGASLSKALSLVFCHVLGPCQGVYSLELLAGKMFAKKFKEKC